MNLKQLLSLLSIFLCPALMGQNSPTLFPVYHFTTGSATEQAAGSGGLPYSVDSIAITWTITTKSGATTTNTVVTPDITPANPVQVGPGVRVTVNGDTGDISAQPVQCGTSLCDGCPDECNMCPECVG